MNCETLRQKEIVTKNSVGNKNLSNKVQLKQIDHLGAIDGDKDDEFWEEVSIPEFNILDESDNFVANPELLPNMIESPKTIADAFFKGINKNFIRKDPIEAGKKIRKIDLLDIKAFTNKKLK